MVTKCLTEASNKGYTSIVFPALGTGKLNYPRDETARTMLETADGFQRSNPLTSLRDVRIVVYQKDTQTVQVSQFGLRERLHNVKLCLPMCMCACVFACVPVCVAVCVIVCIGGRQTHRERDSE